MIAIHALRIAYMAVPKAACTTVKSMLATIDPDLDESIDRNVDVQAAHAIYPTQRFRPHRFAKTEGYYRFTVVRDPLKRLLSVYTNRVVDLKELHASPRLRAQDELPLDPDPDTFFANLDTYREKSSSIRHHTMPVWLFTGSKLDVYTDVYRTGQIEELADILSGIAEHPVTIPHANKSSHSLDIDDLKPATRDDIRERLAEEYSFLSGYFENPFT